MNVSRALTGLVAIAIVSGGVMGQQRKASDAAHGTSPSQRSPSATTPEAIQWNAVGSGTEFAVLSGTPDAEGAAFVIRLRFADQVRVPPHWHPVDEHITVIAGTFYMGMGERVDESTAKEMPAGSYGFMPKDMRHFGWAKGATIIQIHGVGPFKTNWVDPTGKPTTN
jgi:quercetin dioxygenase-like cupin family protein